jgi:hypothetical protein
MLLAVLHFVTDDQDPAGPRGGIGGAVGRGREEAVNPGAPSSLGAAAIAFS